MQSYPQENPELVPPSPSHGRLIHRSLMEHLWLMPAWHRRILFLAVVLIGLGAVGIMRKATGMGTKHQSVSLVRTQSSPAGNGFVGEPSAPLNEVQGGVPTTTDTTQPWYLSPRMLAIGASTLGGFVIGWAMRAFVKTVSLAIVAIGGLLATASYFRFFNVDFSAAHQQFDSAASWASTQAGLLKDSAIAHLPSHASAVVGAWIGFRRR